LRKDGSEFPLELSLGAWHGGARHQYTGVVRDITERRRAERYMAAQYEVARVLADNPTPAEAAPQLLAGIGESMGWQVGGLWLIDADADALRCEAFWHAQGVEVEAFEAASRTIQLSRRVGLPGRVWQLGKPVWIPDAAREPNFPRAQAAIEVGLHGGIGLPIVSGRDVIGVIDFFSPEIKRPDAELLDMMATIGAQLGQFFQRKRAEEALATTAAELKRRAAELERSNADLEQFAYVASHDLSEPLRMVSGFVQLLAQRYRGQLDANADEFIDFTVDGVGRMQQLIDDLLAFSRVGKGEGEGARVDCDAAVRRALGSLAAQIEESGGAVEAETLPPVIGRDAEINQLFQNLLSNAWKFSGEEPPQVCVRAEPDGDMWLFSVIDNGIGIESRHAERIFKMFQRLHARDAYPGTGIGLPICKRVVERHGGRIWVEPAPGGGSAFRFTLPALDRSTP
ncbi:MAG: hypothetical protein QOD76_1374, partial [Solirubrobacteraceae bacterium]|nr:hypothetical protein [Solirubrobacteraceae bacterium]